MGSLVQLLASMRLCVCSPLAHAHSFHLHRFRHHVQSSNGAHTCHGARRFVLRCVAALREKSRMRSCTRLLQNARIQGPPTVAVRLRSNVNAVRVTSDADCQANEAKVEQRWNTRWCRYDAATHTLILLVVSPPVVSSLSSSLVVC